MSLLRSAAFNLWFYGLTVLFCLGAPAAVGLARLRGRHAAMRYGRCWARLALAGLRPLAGIDWTVQGEIPARGPALLAAQHQSAFETVLWTVLLPDFCFIVKRELMGIPLFGWVLRAAGMIGVDRGGGASAMRALLRAGGEAASAGRQIVIFPEGTRVEPGVRARLHPGIAALAARTGLPVIPVVTDSGRLWGRNAFHKRPGTIHVQVLPALAAGLTREAVLARLAEAFATGPGR